MTVSTREKLFAVCIENGMPQGVFDEIFQIVESEIEGMDKANRELYRSNSDLKTKYENGQRAYSDLLARQNAKLMSVFYLLDAVQKTGTHREKETVIMYMKVILDGLVQRDPLSLNDDLLPF